MTTYDRSKRSEPIVATLSTAWQGHEAVVRLGSSIFIVLRTRVSAFQSRCQRFSGEGARYKIATKNTLEIALTEAPLQA